MPKKVLTYWKGFEAIQHGLEERGEDTLAHDDFFTMLRAFEGTADIYDQHGNSLDNTSLYEHFMNQRRDNPEGDGLSSEVFYLQDRENSDEVYELNVSYSGSVPHLNLNTAAMTEKEWKIRTKAPATDAEKAELSEALGEMVMDGPVLGQDGQPLKKSDLEKNILAHQEEKRTAEIAVLNARNAGAEQELAKEYAEKSKSDVFYMADPENENNVYPVEVDYSNRVPALKKSEQPIAKTEMWNRVIEHAFPDTGATIYDKDGNYFGKRVGLQDYFLDNQQKKLNGESVEDELFYVQAAKNEKTLFAVSVSYDQSGLKMVRGFEPLSKAAQEHMDKKIAQAEAAQLAEENAPDSEVGAVELAQRKEAAVDNFLAAWKEVEDFKKSPGMEKRGMDILSTNKLNRALEGVQNVAVVYDKDGKALQGDEWTSYLTNAQSRFEKGEKMPQDTFYLQCKDNEEKMFKLSVDYGKTKPSLKLDKTPLPDKDRLEMIGKWNAEKTAHEAFKEAGLDLNDIRARREWIASAPKRLLDAFKGVQSVKKETNFKRPNLDMGVLELRKNLENVQDVATVCDAEGNKLEGDAWLEHVAAKQILRASGEKIPKDTFYLTCKDDNSKMFKVTVDYGKNKPKFKIDKTPVYEDERWRLRGEWQKNAAAAQKAAAQLDVKDPNAEDSPEKQNQKEKTAVAAKNMEKGAAVEKNAEKVAKKATETVITPSLDERLKAAGKDANGYTEPSWKKYDVNAQKSGTGAVMEMGELKPLEELAEEPRTALKNLAQELAEKEKEWDAKRSPEERDMDHINKKVNSMAHKEIDKSLKKNDPDAKEQTKDMTKAFRRDILDAAKENDSVRSLLANMENSMMQQLYKTYSNDVTNGIDPKLKGVLNEAVRLAEAEKNAGIGAIDKSAEYFPLIDSEDLEQNQVQQQQEEENKALEGMQVNPM